MIEFYYEVNQINKHLSKDQTESRINMQDGF